MPRKPRYFLSDMPVHIVQRGHSRESAFFEAEDYANYCYWVAESSKRYEMNVHTFMLMTNHTHLLVTASAPESISLFMQNIGRRFTPYSNRKYKRSRSVWEGRFKASLVQTEHFFLRVMVYIELNPVRAAMVDLPSHYKWSSFSHNVGRRKISFIKPHRLYQRLGKTTAERIAAYKLLFRVALSEDEIDRIGDCWKSGTPLGNDKFRDKIERQLERAVGYERRGRPKGVLPT